MTCECGLNCNLGSLKVTNLTHHDDVWIVAQKRAKPGSKGELDLGKLADEEDKEELEKEAEDYKEMLEKVKKILDEKVSEVRISHRLTQSPACLVTGDYGMSLNMERIMKEAGQDMAGMMGMGGSKPIFEINPEHPLVSRLSSEADEQKFEDLTRILFDQAILSEGGQLDDPAAFVHNLNGVLQGVMG